MSVVRGRKYDRSLMGERGIEDIEDAPGGEAHEAAFRAHGPARELTIKFEGPSRWRVASTHSDGYKHTSVYAEAHVAHQRAATLLGADNPPVGLQTTKNSRNLPVGPKEEIAQARHDKREPETVWEDFEIDQ